MSNPVSAIMTWTQQIAARRRMRKLRAMMRGYRLLRDQKRLDAIDHLKDRLAHIQIVPSHLRGSSSLLGDVVPDLDRSLRQYLMVRIGSISLNVSLLSCLGSKGAKVAHPMPPQWRKEVAAAGFPVDNLRSGLLWRGYVFLLWGFGVLNALRQVTGALRSSADSNRNLAASAYFDRLAPSNLPNGAPVSREIMSWYAQWPGRSTRVRALTHNLGHGPRASAKDLPVCNAAGPVPAMAPKQVPRFLGWILIGTLTTLLDQLRNRWWTAALLHEAVLARVVALVPAEALPADYLFHNSGWLYRPLWSYAAEQKGARILFYFYSTNCEIFKRADGYPLQTGHWELCSWSHYLVWDHQQQDFLSRAGIVSKITVVGPIWFSDSLTPVEIDKTRPLIAVFDVQPMRPSYYRSLAIGFEYYVAANAIAFIAGIDEATRSVDVQLLWKRKRDIGKRIDPLYARAATMLFSSTRWHEVNPAVSAERLIDQADIVISAPFTSTALIAVNKGKPSCYYDPLAVLQPDDRGAHGVLIVRSAEALRQWIATHRPSDFGLPA